MLVIIIIGIILIAASIIISYKIGYSKGFNEGRDDMDVKISAALRNIRKDYIK
jgi:hypothetical protein